MNETQIRWEKKIAHFQNEFSSFDEAVELANMRLLSKLEQQGII